MVSGLYPVGAAGAKRVGADRISGHFRLQRMLSRVIDDGGGTSVRNERDEHWEMLER